MHSSNCGCLITGYVPCPVEDNSGNDIYVSYLFSVGTSDQSREGKREYNKEQRD